MSDFQTYKGRAQWRRIVPADTPAIDAFGRFRVSNPETLFDSKNIFNDPDIAAAAENQPLFYDNQETSGSGTGTQYLANESSQELSVGATTAGTRVRQTKMRFNYQPGKSQAIFLTFNLKGGVSGITKREGVFDENNGLYLELDGTSVYLVVRTKTSGSVVNTRIAQSNWSHDTFDGSGPSGITLDFSKTQILLIDYEWLGVGRVRFCFVVDGIVYYAHTINNTNVLDLVYMQTPNLPLRSEISNDGTGVAATIEQICSTVVSEGATQDLGVIRSASTNGTHTTLTTENVIYAIIGIRLKSAYIGESIKILNKAVQIQSSSDQVEWILKLNPTVADTFAYADETNSAVQIARGASANTVTGGFDLGIGYAESGGIPAGSAGSSDKGLNNAILLGSLIDGTVDTIVLCARPIGGSSAVEIEGSITWRELT